MRILLCLFPLVLTFCWNMVKGGGGGGGGLEDMKQMDHALPYENSNSRRTPGAKPKGTGRTHSGTKQKSSYQASGSASNSSAYSTAKGTGSSGYYSYYTGTGDSRYSYRRSRDSRRKSGNERSKSGDRRRSGDDRKSGGVGQRWDSRQTGPRSVSQGRRSGTRQSDYNSKWFGGSRTSQYSRYSEMQPSGDKATRSMWKIEIKPEEFAELLRVIGVFLASNGLGVDKAYTEKELAVNMQASGRQSFINLLEPSGANKTIKEAIKAAFGAIAEGGGQTGNPQIEGIKSMLSCWTLALLVINCMSAVDGGEMASQLSRMQSQRSMMPTQMSEMAGQSGMPSQMPTNQPTNPDMIRQRLEIAKKRSQEIDMLIQGKKNVAAISDAQVIIINILNDKIGDNFITNTCTKNVTMKEGRATSSYYSGGASTTRATDGSYYSSTYSRSDSRRRSGSRNSKGREGNKSTGGGGIIDSIAGVFGRRKSSSGRERSGTRERGSDSSKYRRESSRETGKEGRARSSSRVREGSGSRGESSRHNRISSRNDRERDGRRKSESKTNAGRKSGGGERGTRKSGSGNYSSSSYGKSGYSGYYSAYSSSSHNRRKSNSGGRTSYKSGGRRKSGHGH